MRLRRALDDEKQRGVIPGKAAGRDPESIPTPGFPPARE